MQNAVSFEQIKNITKSKRFQYIQKTIFKFSNYAKRYTLWKKYRTLQMPAKEKDSEWWEYEFLL